MGPQDHSRDPQGQAADIEIQAKEILYTKALLNKFMSESTGPKEATKQGFINFVAITNAVHTSQPNPRFLVCGEGSCVRLESGSHLIQTWANELPRSK